MELTTPLTTRSINTTVDPEYYRYMAFPLPRFVTYSFICLCFVGFFLGSLGNVLVILAITKTKKLRTTANTFLASLAVADLGTCLFVLPILALAFISLETVVTVQVLCRLYYHLSFIFSPVSIQHLILIAVSRYTLINRSPGTYVKLFNKTSISVVIGSIWTANITLNVAVANYSFKTARFYGKDYCYVEQTNVLGLLFWLLMIFTTFFSCFVIIPLFYVFTFRTVRKSRIRVEQEMTSIIVDQPTVPAVSTNLVLQTTGPPRQSRRLLSSSEVTLTRVNFFIFLTNVLFLSPLLAVLVFGGIGVLTHSLFALILLPMSLNSVANPLVYCGFNRHFRQAFRKLLRLF